MPSSQIALREAARLWRHPFRNVVKPHLPRGLFARSLMIIVVPMVLLQMVAIYVYFERHFDFTTTRLTRAMATNIELLIKLHRDLPEQITLAQISQKATEVLNVNVTFHPNEALPPGPLPNSTKVDTIFRNELTPRFGDQYWFNTERADDLVDIRVALDNGVLQILSERKIVIATNWHIFIVWMILASVVLVSLAILFLRNQIRPIQRLATAAEEFGKGGDVPNFRPSGATEVRAAAAAFLDMKDRIQRYIQQRTEMLAGVSHDLRTPLTRIKLSLAMLDGEDIAELRSDVRDMERMLEEYLAFARGQGGEGSEVTDITALLSDVTQSLGAAKTREINLTVEGQVEASVRRQGLKRCVTNLVENALKYGTRVDVSLKNSDEAIEIAVDDNGPGIPANRREDVFRPFFRLDAARNVDEAGVGLGLSIARDVARAHGGDITLSDSKLGGLRALLRLPK